MDPSKKQKTDVVTAELQRGFEWTTQHTTLVVSLLAVMLIGGGGFTAWKMISESKEKDLQAKYYDLEAVVNKKRADFEMAKNPQPGQPAPTGVTKPSGDLAKDYGDVTQSLAEFVRQHPKSAAGSMAALNLASLQTEYNQSAEAIQTLKTVDTQKNLLGALVRMELATQLANSGNCPEAVTMWKDLTSLDSAKFLKAEAKLKMGLCAETQGDVAQAQSIYKEVESEFKESAAGRSASQYLRLLSSKSETPKTN